MAYATVADMIARFGELEVLQLTDRNQEGVIDKAVAKTALDDATAEIDAYLGRFKRPFGKIPPLLVDGGSGGVNHRRNPKPLQN